MLELGGLGCMAGSPGMNAVVVGCLKALTARLLWTIDGVVSKRFVCRCSLQDLDITLNGSLGVLLLPWPYQDVRKGKRSACWVLRVLSFDLETSFFIHSSFEMSSAVSRSDGRYCKVAARSFCRLIISSVLNGLRAPFGFWLDRISCIRTSTDFDGPGSWAAFGVPSFEK